MHEPDVDRLLNLASGCEEAIRRRLDDLDHLSAELEALDGQTCTGREWWRDKGHPTKAAKLYILHSISQACPVHGTPATGERLRVYIGCDRRKIVAARAAMDREGKRRDLEIRLEALRRGLSSCDYRLRTFYRLLNYQVGDDGQTEPRRRGDTAARPG